MRRLALVWGAAALSLCACAVGPNFHRPAADAPARYTAAPLPQATAAAPVPLGGAQRLQDGADLPAQWWTLFGSPRLSALVAQALAANPDLAAARAALRQSHELALAQAGTLLPQLSAGYQVMREKSSQALSPVLSTNDDIFTLHTATLTLGYTLDVFGGLRRQLETARAQETQQRFLAEAARLSVTTNVVNGAIDEAMLSDEVAADRRLVAIATDILQIYRRQKALGAVTGVDIATQETALAQAQALLPPLEKALAAQRDALAQLTGRRPAEQEAAPASLTEFTLPADVPVSLPSRLADQRPDVRAAEANLHAATAQVGVAVANRLPQIALTGQAGGSATALSSILDNPNTFWSLAGDVAQPIFQGGALLHRQRAAQAARDQAREQYRSTVLTAFQQVADALSAIEADGRGLAAAAQAETSAGAALQITRRQQALGQVGGLQVLLAQQTYETAVLARIQAQGARLSDTVALFQALGGGWWNRPGGAAGAG